MSRLIPIAVCVALWCALAGRPVAQDTAPNGAAKVENFPVARVTGSPTLHGGRLYVPVASSEEGAGSSPAYECCRFRGSVVALDAATGKQVSKTYSSGAPVRSSPAIDVRRNALYVTSGNN